MKNFTSILSLFFLINTGAQAATGTERVDPRTVKFASRTYTMTVSDCLSRIPAGAPAAVKWTCAVTVESLGVAFPADRAMTMKRIFPGTTIRASIEMFASQNGPMLEISSQDWGAGGFPNPISEAAVRREIETAFKVHRLTEVQLNINVFVLK